MLEIEQKYHVADLLKLESQLQSLGAKFRKEQTEVDHYFNAPDRDFAQTGEAFRIRRVNETNTLTYKGPKQAGLTVKVRQELELSIAEGHHGAETATAMLTALGYRAVAVIRKIRKQWTLQEMVICLDQCEKVGTFAEIEIVTDEAMKVQAIAAIEELATQLKLGQAEPRSYLRMWLGQ
jgi:adenylate cyclase, class 2